MNERPQKAFCCSCRSQNIFHVLARDARAQQSSEVILAPYSASAKAPSLQLILWMKNPIGSAAHVEDQWVLAKSKDW